MNDELVKRLREHNGWALNETLDKAADAIEELQKAVNFHKFNSEFWEDKYNSLAEEKWIPVTERLPEQGKQYLVMRYDSVTKTPFIDILWHDAHDLWWNRLYKGQYAVTHWMPLPEPPKEDDNEGD